MTIGIDHGQRSSMSVSKASFAGSRSGSRPHPPHDNDREADDLIVPEKRRCRNRTKVSINTFVSANIKPRPPPGLAAVAVANKSWDSSSEGRAYGGSTGWRSMLREDHSLTVLPLDKVQIADIPTRTREIITIGALPRNAHARGSATS